MSKLPLKTLVFLILAVAGGCNDNPDVAPVSGVVMMDGKPLAGGRIMFEPIADGEDKLVGKSAFGQIAEDGTFTLSTYGDQDGAVVGSHHPVVFGDRQEEDRSLNPKGIRTGPNIGVIRMKDSVYEVVANQQNDFTIEIKSRSYDVQDAIRND